MFVRSISSNFKYRFLIGSLAILVISVFIYFSLSYFFLFTLFCSGIVGLALSEYYNLAKKKGFSPFEKWSIAASIFYFIALAIDIQFSSTFSLWVLLGFAIASFALSFSSSHSAIVNLAITFFGIGYLTLPLSCILRIDTLFTHGPQDGRIWLFYVLLISKMTDIGAYVSGKMWGKTKLAPTISPKKTLVGAFGGLFTAIGISFLFAQIVPIYHPFNMSFLESLFIGLMIGCLAQFGDLAESLLKRDGGTKDSSDIPGFGGVLDTVDSLIFTLPCVYFWLL